MQQVSQEIDGAITVADQQASLAADGASGVSEPAAHDVQELADRLQQAVNRFAV